MKNNFIKIQLFADEEGGDKGQETPPEESPYKDLIQGYQDRETALKEEVAKLKQQVKDYSDFLKTTPMSTKKEQKSSEELISNLIKGGRYNG